AAVLNVVGADAVHLIVVVLDGSSAGGEITGTAAAAAEVGGVVDFRIDAGIQADDLRKVARGEGKLDDHSFAGDATEGARGGLKLLGIGRHGDLLADGADFETRIEGRGVGDIDTNRREIEQLEPGLRNFDAIETRREQGSEIDATGI